MKKFVLSLTVLFSLCGISTLSAQKSTIIQDILVQTAIEKVTEIQKIIKFTDEDAQKLIKIEFQFLLDVEKAENCFLCNSNKRTEKLERKRQEAIEKILSRDQYLKYNAIEKGRIKKHTLHA